MDVGVLILGCDRAPYHRVWDVMHRALDLCWPARPWPVYLATQQRADGFPGWTTVRTGAPTAQWGRHVVAATRLIKHRWLLVLMDDYLASAPWDDGELRRLAQVVDARSGKYLRVVPTPGPDILTSDPGVGIHSYGMPYRASLQPCLFDREYLARLAGDCDSPWNFETFQPGDRQELHLSVVRENRPLSYCNGLVRGVWQDDAAALCARHGWRDPFR